MSGDGLLVPLVGLAVFLVVVGGIAAIVAWRARRRGSTTVVLDVALTIAGWWLALCAIGVIFQAVTVFTASSISFGDSSLLSSWPTDVPCLDDPSSTTDAALECTSGTGGVWLVNPDPGLRLLAFATSLTGILLLATPAALIFVITWQALRGRPFARSVMRGLVITAIAVVVLGIVNPVLSSIGNTLALRAALPPDGSTGRAMFSLSIEPWPFCAALALLALAAVFRHGLRLQRDTEGLV